MKKFIISRVRLVLVRFICYIPCNISPWLLFPSLRSWQRDLNKCGISAIYQPAEENLLMWKAFLRVDLREYPSEKFFTRAIRSATKLYNKENDVKRVTRKKNVSFQLATIRNELFL